MTEKKRRRKWLLIPGGIIFVFFLLNFFLQYVVAHQFEAFLPRYPQEDLASYFDRAVLTDSDYDTLFAQTGLGRAAVDDLRSKGDVGLSWLTEIQQAFFAPRDVFCRYMGFITREERLRDASGGLAYGPVLAPLQDGDILLSFSTHTYGWRHGHAGMVVDAEHRVTLEAAVWGSNSQKADLDFWRTYSTAMVLRPKGLTPQQREDVAQFALTYLDGVPYHLTSGVFGDKAPDPEGDVFAQCAYLIWYAYQASGLDLDSDGGRIVTVNDLAESDLLDVVQIYGLDPAEIPPQRR